MASCEQGYIYFFPVLDRITVETGKTSRMDIFSECSSFFFNGIKGLILMPMPAKKSAKLQAIEKFINLS
jgi:hypothetical protein